MLKGPGGATIALLNGQIYGQAPPRCLGLYSQICAILNLHRQASFYSEQWLIQGLKTDNVLRIYSNPHPPRNILEEGVERIRARGWGGLLGTAVLWIGHSCCTHKATAAMVTYSRAA